MYEVVRAGCDVTSITAIRSAIYRMSGELGLICRKDGESYVVESTEQVDGETLKLFLRHLNDYQLRETILERTGVMRDAILGAALMRLTESEDDR